jgi:hypothetical protein
MFYLISSDKNAQECDATEVKSGVTKAGKPILILLFPIIQKIITEIQFLITLLMRRTIQISCKQP